MIKNILEYLEITAEKYPQKIAFADIEQSCTFSELEKEAKKAGSYLHSKGCLRKPIPIFMEKSVETIKVMLGVVYAGAFYVILDAGQPIERLNSILDTLQTDVMIVDKKYYDRVSQSCFTGEIIISENIFQKEIDEKGLSDINKIRCDIDPLYIIFTSGSTGIPKGVVVSHRSVIDFIEPYTSIFEFTENDVIGNQAPWDFDISVKDIYAGIKTGATVQIIPKKYFSFPKLLLDFLEERKVTNLTWAVSALCIISMMNGLEYKVPSSLKRIMFSGEAMPIRHLNYWRKYFPNVMFVNLYGPTEITCNCTYYIVDREFENGDSLPIGKAFPNEKVFLLNEEENKIEDAGIKGEICVSGTALAMGYYNNPKQTAKAFVQNPLNPYYPEIIYRTGDIGFYGEKGELYFFSRKDFQIKHMGHRVELGEIEYALEKIETIKRSCCCFDKEKNKIICFYQGDVEKKVLYKELGKILPNYMLPDIFQQLVEFPLTKNGKIDRKKLMDDRKK